MCQTCSDKEVAEVSTPQRIKTPESLKLREGLAFDEVEKSIGVAWAAAGLRHRVVAFYLREVHERGLHQLAGHRSVIQYAMRCFSMSRRDARDLLAAGRALYDLPLIDQAFAQGRLCWSKIRELIKVASDQHEQRWLETALELRIDELALEVRLARAGGPPRDRSGRKGLPEIRLQFGAKLPPEVYAKLERAREKVQDESGRALEAWQFVEALVDLALAFDDDGCVEGRKRRDRSNYTAVIHADCDVVETNDGDVPVSGLAAELAACDCGCMNLDDPEAEIHRISQGLRRRVMARDGFRCRGCRCRHRLQLHHIIHFSRGGPTVYSNLITVCRDCHALLHTGLLTIEGTLKTGWRFLDRDGEDLSVEMVLARFYGEPGGEVAALELPEHGGVPERPVRLDDVPREIDRRWWRRHAHLLKVNETHGGFELTPGSPVELGEESPEGVRGRNAPLLSDLVGQADVIASLRSAVESARRGGTLGHTLLTGPKGLGKTTIARALVAEVGARMHAASGPLLKTPLGLVGLLAELGEGDVLFIDEIHALARPVAEFLYEALQDHRLSLVLRCGGRSRTVTLQLASFTLIAATTDEGQLPEPLLDRFINTESLDFYSPQELAQIMMEVAQCADLPIDENAAAELAEVSRQTPRQALRLLRSVSQDAVAAGRSAIGLGAVARTLDRLRIDGRGLGPVDRRILEVLEERGGRPLGARRLARAAGVTVTTLEEVHEPYLMRLELIDVTPHGRVAVRVQAKVNSSASALYTSTGRPTGTSRSCAGGRPRA